MVSTQKNRGGLARPELVPLSAVRTDPPSRSISHVKGVELYFERSRVLPTLYPISTSR